MDGGMLVMTRHLPLYMPQWSHATEGTHVPIGCKLQRPFADARVYQVVHTDGWIYVYWISASLTYSAATSYPEDHDGTLD